jgi:hypothetical protein
MLRRMRSYWLIACLCVVLAAALFWQAAWLSFTADEPSHFAAGYAYWLNKDYLFPSDTPPLTRILGGWIPLALGAPRPETTPSWPTRNAYMIGSEIVNAMTPQQARRVITMSRAPFILFPLAIVLVIWLWARDMFGATVAGALAVCAAGEPTLIGHGALIKSDVPAAAMAVLFGYLAWRYWERPSKPRFIAMSAVLIAAVLTKFTLLALVPVAVGIALIRGRRVAGAAATLIAIYVAMLAAYQFHAGRVSKAELGQVLRAGVGIDVREINSVSSLLPWPTQFLKGVTFIGAADKSAGFGAYMLGHSIRGAQPLYYPLCWAIKSPIAFQILCIAGAVTSLIAAVERRGASADAVIWGFAAYFAWLAIRSHFHIGFRHFMPVLPFMILGCGFFLANLSRRWMQAGAAALVLWAVAASVWIFPNGISYFNEWIGGPRNGWRYLADSNIDWGQNFRDLGRYVSERKIPTIRVALFGLDAIGHYIPSDRFEFFDPASPPAPGVYAISVNTLLGAPDYQPGPHFAWFRSRMPDATAGYSILVYRVSASSANGKH